MTNARERRLDALEAATGADPELDAVLETLRRIFDLSPAEVAELIEAPGWAIEALQARLEGREPVPVHAVDWRECGCALCKDTRRIYGAFDRPGACRECGITGHVENSMPHDRRRWIGRRLETFAEAGERPRGGKAS